MSVKRGENFIHQSSSSLYRGLLIIHLFLCHSQGMFLIYLSAIVQLVLGLAYISVPVAVITSPSGPLDKRPRRGREHLAGVLCSCSQLTESMGAFSDVFP